MENRLAKKFHTILKERVNFDRIFAPLKLQKYHNAILGFDVVKFDEDLKTPNDVSTRDFVLQKYGQDGLELIEKLLNA